MNNITIIGAGKLGTVLGRALVSAGYRIRALSCGRIESARESRAIIGEGEVYIDNSLAAEKGEVIIMAVRDFQIKPIAEELAGSGISWMGKAVFHCSGLLSSGILDSLKNEGAVAASFHPIQSFLRKDQSPLSFQNIYFGIEGDKSAVGLARNLVRKIGARSVLIDSEYKALYHASCCMASNNFAALLDVAAELMEAAGIERDQAGEMLYPLVQGTLQNVKKIGIQASISGPVARGDAASIRMHMRALKKVSGSVSIYKMLSRRLLGIMQNSGLSREKIRALSRLLEDK